MNVNNITKLLEDNREVILSYSTKSDRLDCIVNLFEQRFPQVTISDALTGPITNMTAMVDNLDAQKLIECIKRMKEIPENVIFKGFPGSQDYEAIMKYIQEFIIQ